MEKDVFYLATSVGQRKNQNFKIKVPISIVNLPTTKSLWLSGKASERGILRSVVRFFMGTESYFFIPRSC